MSADKRLFRWHQNLFHRQSRRYSNLSMGDPVRESIQLATCSLGRPGRSKANPVSVLGRSFQLKQRRRPTSPLSEQPSSHPPTTSYPTPTNHNNDSTAEASLGRQIPVCELKTHQLDRELSVKPTNQPCTSLTQVIRRLFTSSKPSNDIARRQPKTRLISHRAHTPCR